MASIEKRQNNDGTTGYIVKVRLKGHPTQTATFERLPACQRHIVNHPAYNSPEYEIIKQNRIESNGISLFYPLPSNSIPLE